MASNPDFNVHDFMSDFWKIQLFAPPIRIPAAFAAASVGTSELG
jgi:hypothetical protein